MHDKQGKRLHSDISGEAEEKSGNQQQEDFYVLFPASCAAKTGIPVSRINETRRVNELNTFFNIYIFLLFELKER